MNIEELRQLGLSYEDKITMEAYIIPAFSERQKATFIALNKPDGRKNKYNLAVKLYSCSTITLIDIDDLVSVVKGWE